MIVGGIGCLFPNLEAFLRKYDYETLEPVLWKRWAPVIVVELFGTGILWAYTSIWEQVMYLTFMMFLVFLACFDVKYMLLPSKVIYLGEALGIIFQVGRSWMTQSPYYLISGLLGGGVGVILFILVWWGAQKLFKKEGLGFGDVRLMGMLGLYIGLELLFLMILVASLIAAIVGLGLLIWKRKSEAFPFGPFLCFASLIMVVFEEPILSLYLSWIGI